MNNPACSICGAPLNPTAAACSRCGIPMSQMPGHDQPQNQFNYQLQGEQPSPGPQDYSGQGYGNQGRGSQAYGGPAYGNQAYGNQAYRSEEHTSELQSLMRISYAVFCLKTTKTT